MDVTVRSRLLKLLTQIAEDLRWIRISLEKRGRIQQEENEDQLTTTPAPAAGALFKLTNQA